MRLRHEAAIACGVIAAALITSGAARAPAPTGPPVHLADTGLYADFAARTIDPRNVPYAPQYPLWSDGAEKHRWIRLPPGTAIDARDPDHWRFPVGTRIWKEFSWGGRPVETRLMVRTRAGWTYAAYAWSDDGRDAVLVDERGAPTSQEVAPGIAHAIPSVADCRTCHEGGRAPVLGFSALQLSPDRDPLAPHAEPLQPGMPTLDVLARRGLVRGLPKPLLASPPRIEASSPRARAALGYLHANCGTCHDTTGPLASLGLALHQPVRAGAAAPVPSAAAAIARRMGSRAPATQMPPLGTAVVDEEALRLVKAWIAEDPRPDPPDASTDGRTAR